MAAVGRKMVVRQTLWDGGGGGVVAYPESLVREMSLSLSVELYT